MLKRHQNKIANLLFSKYGVQEVDEAMKDIRSILQDDNTSNVSEYKGFKVGDTVEVTRILSGAVISYDGKPEGFHSEHVGETGKIISFDLKTMSSKNVCVSLNGHNVFGNVTCIKHFGE